MSLQEMDHSRPRKRRSRVTFIANSERSKTNKRKSTGPYDHNFQPHLVDHEIFFPLHSYPKGGSPPEPDNLTEIRQALKQRRRSLSPSRFSEQALKSFRTQHAHAYKEAQVMSRVIPTIEGHIEDPHCVSGQIPFNNLDHLTDGTLVAGNPDIYYGARPEQLHIDLQRQLSGKIAPSTISHMPLAPNFFLHVKGPDGSLAVALRQACYDGTLGARGIHCLQSFGQPENQFYDNNAYTISSTYHGGTLTMYTIHPIPPSVPGGKTRFTMTFVNSWSLTGTINVFREGVAAYRNGRDWAKRQRNDAINRANKRKQEADASDSPLKGSPTIGVPSDTPTFALETVATSQHSTVITGSHRDETEISSDELSFSMPTPAKRTKRTKRDFPQKK